MVKKILFVGVFVLAVVWGGSRRPAAAEPQAGVTIEAMVLDISTSEMKKLPLGEGVGLGAKADEKTSAGTRTLDAQQLKTLRDALDSGKVQGKLVSLARLTALDGKEAALSTSEKIHYMVKVGEGTFQLKVLEHEPVRFKVTPTLAHDRIMLELDLQQCRMEGRLSVPEAPDLDIGQPLLSSTKIRTMVSVRRGETLVVAATGAHDVGVEGAEKGPRNCLWLVTADVEK